MTNEDRRLRHAAHTDAEREKAIAMLRVTNADLASAAKRYQECIAARQAWVWRAHDMGIPKTHIARELGLKAWSNVDKLLDRAAGANVNGVRRFYEAIGRGKAIRAARELEQELEDEREKTA